MKSKKISLGNETVCSVFSEKALASFNNNLVLVHPKFPEIKLIVTMNPKGHINYAEDSITIFSDMITNIFNGLNILDFMVAGSKDPFEYSYYSTKQVLSYIVAEVCIYMNEKNLSKFFHYKPYLISSTMILTDGVTASVTSIGDDSCYINNNRVVTELDCKIGNNFIGLPSALQNQVVTLDYGQISALYVLNYELNRLLKRYGIEKLLASISMHKMSGILNSAFLFPKDSYRVPCTAIGLFKNKRRIYKK